MSKTTTIWMELMSAFNIYIYVHTLLLSSTLKTADLF